MSIAFRSFHGRCYCHLLKIIFSIICSHFLIDSKYPVLPKVLPEVGLIFSYPVTVCLLGLLLLPANFCIPQSAWQLLQFFTGSLSLQPCPLSWWRASNISSSSHPLLPASVFPSIIPSNWLAFHIRWPKYWVFCCITYAKAQLWDLVIYLCSWIFYC